MNRREFLRLGAVAGGTIVLGGVSRFGGSQASAAATEARGAKNVQAGLLWVANRIPGSIDLYNAPTGDRFANVRTGEGTLDVAVPLGAGKVYGSDESSGSISVVDAKTLTRMKVIPTGAGTKPHHMDSNPDGTLVYASLFGTNKIAAIDTATDTLIGTWQTGPANALAHGVAVTRDGSTLWVINGSGGPVRQIVELDARTGAMRRALSVGYDSSSITLTPNGKTGFVSDKTTNRIRIYDLETFAEVAAVSVSQPPDTMSLAHNGRILLVGLRGTPAAAAFVDLERLTSESLGLSTVAGTSTGHHALSPDSEFGFIAVDGPALPHIAVLDMGNRSVVARYACPGRPHGVIFERLDP